MASDIEKELISSVTIFPPVVRATYEEMAEQYNLSVSYVRGNIGRELWKKLSKALDESVTKTNFKTALERASKKQINRPNTVLNPLNIKIPFPSGAVSPNSRFYIRRDNIESLCDETLEMAGALIRIKAPKLMGKTSLINSIFDYCHKNGYITVYLDLQAVEHSILENLDKLLRWLCFQVIRQFRFSSI